MRRSVGNIPDYIAASSLNSLRRSMLKVQLRLGYGVTFFDIQKSGKKWVAFYYSNEQIDSNNVGEKLAEKSTDRNS